MAVAMVTTRVKVPAATNHFSCESKDLEEILVQIGSAVTQPVGVGVCSSHSLATCVYVVIVVVSGGDVAGCLPHVAGAGYVRITRVKRLLLGASAP